ncbi:hypothetical protein N658DRAFT_512437 [Parathielavia hyrcaniae]|uniref:Uncharacterized protein n=1 Tax=Parathielavia hyrcaniae TaxID=113614 RepID=A0AAN6T796_9PEZI|nr:hypothetical protein N658DRAFT_512437 [Parathielavia hyrcaniae]
MNRVAFQRTLRMPALRQALLLEKNLPSTLHTRAVSTVAEPSFWKSLVPKPLRSQSSSTPGKKIKPSKGWNPATFFIFIFLLIGSMSIQMIALRKDFATFVRQSDVRIGLLREVVEKLQRGEKVDLEKVLGTGDEEKELEWEAVLKEIDRESPAKQRKKQPEPTPAPSSEADVVPTAQPTRAALQSELASKGFF